MKETATLTIGRRDLPLVVPTGNGCASIAPGTAVHVRFDLATTSGDFRNEQTLFNIIGPRYADSRTLRRFLNDETAACVTGLRRSGERTTGPASAFFLDARYMAVSALKGRRC